MRKDRKATRTADIASVQSYHNWRGDAADRRSSSNYAFNGFRSNKYYTSDRYISLDGDFRRPDGKPLKGFGLEIELESSTIHNQTVLAEVMDKIVFEKFPADLFKMQNDASLGGASNVECITQVMPREFIRNNYAAFKLMFNEYMPAFDVAATANCGMHCNISNAVFGRTEAAQAAAIRKLYYIVNHHYALCCALFNRNPNRTDYCSRMRAVKDECKTMDLTSFGSSHGVSFNLGHYLEGRIELRLVGGQKNYACFRNTMESIFYLCDAVKRLEWYELDDLVAVFSGCNQYVYDRLQSKCAAAGAISSSDLDRIALTVKRDEFL